MLQAEALHREVALLSNTLHTFDDHDVPGVNPVIEKILLKRIAWKDIRFKITHFEKTGSLPEDKPTEEKTVYEGTAAELKVQLNNYQAKIRKLRHKINNNPGHHLAPGWSQELAMLQAIEQSTKMQILQLQYA